MLNIIAIHKPPVYSSPSSRVCGAFSPDSPAEDRDYTILDLFKPLLLTPQPPEDSKIKIFGSNKSPCFSTTLVWEVDVFNQCISRSQFCFTSGLMWRHSLRKVLSFLRTLPWASLHTTPGTVQRRSRTQLRPQMWQDRILIHISRSVDHQPPQRMAASAGPGLR